MFLEKYSIWCLLWKSFKIYKCTVVHTEILNITAGSVYGHPGI